VGSPPRASVHDAAHWDQRYADPARVPFVAPEPVVTDVVSDVVTDVVAGVPGACGTALDIACGEGRHAVWLAEQGWRVTAIDFSAAGIATGRALGAAHGVDVEWVVGDVRTWRPAAAYDLALACFVDLEEQTLRSVRSWLAPGGHLVLVSHGAGTGGPGPRFRTTVAAMRERVGDLEVLECREVAGEAERSSRILLHARRPA